MSFSAFGFAAAALCAAARFVFFPFLVAGSSSISFFAPALDLISSASFLTSAAAKVIAHETKTAAKRAMFAAKKYSQRICAQARINAPNDQIRTNRDTVLFFRRTLNKRTAAPPTAKRRDHPNDLTAFHRFWLKNKKRDLHKTGSPIQFWLL